MDTKALRQKILDLAIHGKLVPQDPNDEPASVLLERIKAEKERLIKQGKIKRSKKSAKTSDTPHYENVPFEVPESWVWTTLGEISNYGDCNNVSVIDIAADEWILELEDLEKDTASIIQMLSKKERNIKGVRHKFKKGDVLYSKLRTYLNKVLVAPKNGFCTTEIIPFNSYCEISNFYLCHVLRSAYFLDYTQQCGYGVKMPRLSTNDACRGMIPLPPLAEQHRIVAEIKRWFALIDQIGQGKADLQTIIKQTKSKILDLAIHGKLVLQDPNDEPAIELLKRINPDFTPCDNGHSEKFPQDWEHILIGDYVEAVTDFVASGSFASLRENVKYYNEPNYAILVRTKDFQNNFKQDLVYTDQHGYDFLAKSNLFGGELIFSNVGSIGKIFIVPELNQKMTLAPNAIMVRFHNDKQQKWFYYLFSSTTGQSLLDSITSATAIGKFNKTDFKKLPIPIPPLAEQQRIVQKIEELFSVLDNIQNALEV